MEKHNNGLQNDPNCRQSSISASLYAPWYNVPGRPIVSVEHPCIIRDVDKGLATLGGLGKLGELLEDDGEPVAKMSLRPGDRMTKPLRSAAVDTSNILLKITVPKRTGLKRKRGTQGPYHGDSENEAAPNGAKKSSQKASLTYNAKRLTHTLRESPKDHRVDLVGMIGQTHRFRGSPIVHVGFGRITLTLAGLPDFVTSTADSPFMAKMREHILPFDYEKMKGFKFDMSKGVKPNTEIIPPPSWTPYTLPFNYSYRQNPAVKKITDSAGNVTAVNLQAAPKIRRSVPFDIPVVPAGPPPEAPQAETLGPAMQRLIAACRRLMEDRPIFTRRALMNCTACKDWDNVGQSGGKMVFQYVGYSFGSGPWRDAVVRYGVDPRNDAQYRFYQTMMLMLDNEPRVGRSKGTKSKPERTKMAQELSNESHIFDGTNVSKDGKLWQVCDITDPLFKDVLATEYLRTECHIESDGWYHNGTWAKIKTILKAKVADILNKMPPNDRSYAKILRLMPDIIEKGMGAARMGTDATQREKHLASTIRSAAFQRRAEDAAFDDGENGGEEQDGEITNSALPGYETLDPSIREMERELGKLEGETTQADGMTGEIDSDGASDSQDSPGGRPAVTDSSETAESASEVEFDASE